MMDAMDAQTMANIARVAADDFRRGKESFIEPALVRELADAIEIALLTAVREERRHCVKECQRRAALWETTVGRDGVSEPMRQEARCRGNEAAYLADTLATR
jgi:uncharacterized protein YgbK (DUF1537 family)